MNNSEVAFWNSSIEQISKYIGEMEAKFFTVGEWRYKHREGKG